MNKGKKVALSAAVVLLGACNGWPDAAPFAEAINKAEPYPTYAAAAGQPVEFYAGNHRYLVMPGEVNLRSARTAPVAASGGGSAFGLAGDEAPYSSVYVRGGDGRTHAAGLID